MAGVDRLGHVGHIVIHS